MSVCVLNSKKAQNIKTTDIVSLNQNRQTFLQHFSQTSFRKKVPPASPLVVNLPRTIFSVDGYSEHFFFTTAFQFGVYTPAITFDQEHDINHHLPGD